MLYREELILAENFLDERLVAQIPLNADQVFVPVLIVHQVEADALKSRGEQPALQDSAKEPRTACDQYGLQRSSPSCNMEDLDTTAIL
jgi:hypothetical protein